MTYCLAMRLERGLVMCSDSRTSAGVDDVSLYSKMHRFDTTIGADNFANGFSATVFIAFLSSLVSRRYTATQYALFSSFMTLPGKLIGGPSGLIVDQAGYVVFFVYASALGIPAIALVIWLMFRGGVDRASGRGQPT